MQTHYLGNEEVKAYLRDFAARLKSLGSLAPTIWVPIGLSGRELAKMLLAVEPTFDKAVIPVPVEFDRMKSEVVLEGGTSERLAAKHVLVIDSSIHSGFTIRAVCDKVAEFGAAGVCSYTLVLKRGASFIPSYWAVSIGDFDRGYFLLDSLPNNHFHDSGPQFGQVRERPRRKTPAGRTPYFHIRKLSKTDIDRHRIDSGTRSLDRTTWADRYYDMVSHEGRITYVLQAGNAIHGYVTIDLKPEEALSIEAVAVAMDQQGHGYGAALIRWAETCARQNECRVISMWGIKEQLSRYQQLGYKTDSSKPAMTLDGEEYHFIYKPVLYHL